MLIVLSNMSTTSNLSLVLGSSISHYARGVFLTLFLSTVEHLVLILLEFLEFLVEFFQKFA